MTVSAPAPVPVELRARNEGRSIVVSMKTGDEMRTVSMSWISALSFLQELAMALRFNELQFEKIVAEMFAREEARRLAKEAKQAAKAAREAQDDG